MRIVIMGRIEQKNVIEVSIRSFLCGEWVSKVRASDFHFLVEKGDWVIMEAHTMKLLNDILEIAIIKIKRIEVT